MAAQMQDPHAEYHISEHPKDWFEIMFGHEYSLTAQQANAFDELSKLIITKRKIATEDPLTEEEERYRYVEGINIMSGQGTGKDFWSAATVLFFLDNMPTPKVVCTAPTKHQLSDVLWAEIAKLMRKSKPIDDRGYPAGHMLFDKTTAKPYLVREFEHNSEKVFAKERKGKEWFAVSRSVNVKASAEDQAETLQGFHEDFLLFVIDEASGVPDPVFRPIEGTLTGKCNIVLQIYNPTRSRGWAIESHKDTKRWISLRWNAEDSELVTPEKIQSMKEKYGESSNTYRIRVKGLPPIVDEDTLIPWDWVEDAVGRETITIPADPIMVGVDVGAGGDKSVIAIRQGAKLMPLKKFSVADTMVLVGHISRVLEEFEVSSCVIDTIGIGIGVYNRLKELGYRNVYAGDVRRKALNDEKFGRKRDELWWKVREAFESGIISIPDDQDLINQLGSIKYEIDSSGKVKIDSKSDMKKVIDHSPDEADALVLTYYLHDSIFRKMTDRYEDGLDDGWAIPRAEGTYDRYSWMRA